MNWKKWTAIGITVAVVATGIILHLVQPTISFAWTELMCACAFIAGGVSGYLAKGHIVKKNDGNDYANVKGSKK
jgi:hypothetical protein